MVWTPDSNKEVRIKDSLERVFLVKGVYSRPQIKDHHDTKPGNQ